MPTGGVTRENAGEWIRAGAVAIGVGTALVDAKAVGGAAVRRRSRQTRAHFVEAVRSARGAAVRRGDEDRCFGEIMLRLSPPGFERLLPVAAAAGHVRRRRGERRRQPGAVRLRQPLRDAPAGQPDRRCRAQGAPRRRRERRARPARRRRVSASTSPRPARASAPSTVVYDRAHSAISEMAARQHAVGTTSSTGAAWFHWTGITPALGAAAAACTREAIQAATAERAFAVSVDLNYRMKLWSEARGAAT